MSESPLVSVCLPVYNGAKHLGCAIESVLAQDFSDFELLIADDGSSDTSIEIARAYAEKDKRICFWVNQERQGLFGNYNVCIRAARGKFIKPFAQDDLLAPQALSRMLAAMSKSENIALVSSSRRIIDSSGKESELKQPLKQDQLLPGSELIRFHLIGLNNWIGEPSTVMFQAIHAGSGFDPAYYHYGDIEYWFRIIEGRNYFYLHQPLAAFRRHESSQTDTNHKQLYFALDILRMSLNYRHYLSDFESEQLFRKRLIEKIALEFKHLLAQDPQLIIDYQNSFLQPVSGSRSSPSHEQAKSESEAFRLLAAYALSSVSELIAELDYEKRCRDDEHKRFVGEVNKMKESIYWKLSNPLRKVRALIKGADKGSDRGTK